MEFSLETSIQLSSFEETGESPIETYTSTHRQRFVEAQLLDGDCEEHFDIDNYFGASTDNSGTLREIDETLDSLKSWQRSRESRIEELQRELESYFESESARPETEEVEPDSQFEFPTRNLSAVQSHLNSRAVESLQLLLSPRSSVSQSIPAELALLLSKLHLKPNNQNSDPEDGYENDRNIDLYCPRNGTVDLRQMERMTEVIVRICCFL